MITDEESFAMNMKTIELANEILARAGIADAKKASEITVQNFKIWYDETPKPPNVMESRETYSNFMSSFLDWFRDRVVNALAGNTQPAMKIHAEASSLRPAIGFFLAHQTLSLDEPPVLIGMPNAPYYCLVCSEGMRGDKRVLSFSAMEEEKAKAEGWPIIVESTFPWQNLAGVEYSKALETIAQVIEKMYEQKGYVLENAS